jgi:hypothetical protein
VVEFGFDPLGFQRVAQRVQPRRVQAALLFGGTGVASASQDIGWIYTDDLCGSAYFDADYSGHLNEELLKVYDRCPDGRGAVARWRGGAVARWRASTTAECVTAG